MEDIEIARNTKLEDINVIARKLNVEDDIEQYGKHKAKISLEVMKTFKAPIGYRCKRIVSWNITEDNYQIEQCQGTFLEFVKWLVTHESFEITEKIKK